MAREPRIRKELGFTGQWLPDQDPLVMGEENFAKLENYRYIDGGIEPIEGYTEITTTAMITYLKSRASIHLRTPYTQKTYVVCEAWDTDLSAARIRENITTIPNQGNFETTYLFTPASGAATGRFGRLPRGIGYSNEQESCIWDGDEMRAGAIFAIDSITNLTATNPIDYTEILSNSLDTSGNTVASLGSTKEILLGSTRPLQGFKVYVETANATASTMTVKEWQGSWTTLTVVDGTYDHGDKVSLAQTGTVTWTATGSAEPAYIEGVYLYLYHIALSAGDATLYQITVNAAFQQVVDIWDGVFREIASFQADIGSGFEDYTLQVLESTGDLDYFVAAEIGQFTTTHSIRVMFEDRLTAIRIEMVPTKVNSNVAVLTIKYWNGSAYATVGTIYDGTLDDAAGTKTLNQTGVIYWVPPAETSEHPKTEFGVTGYSYEITTSALLSGSAQADILIDLVYGIPAQKTIRGHKFPSRFQGHAMWCGDIVSKEENKVDYSATNAPDVYNGEDSSDHGKSLYFGGPEKLTAAVSLYNRFGARIYETWLAFKESETYLLDGTGPDDFRIYQISENYGCPAPQTLAAAETAYEVTQDTVRNIAIWLSYRGPVLFDGAVIVPLRGVDIYFDKRKSTCINYTYITNARGWFDSYWMEYNLLIPSGTDQVANNVWLTYDLRRKRWFRRKLPAAARYPQDAVVVKDEQGASYSYVFTDNGDMHRNEYGTTWNGETITHLVRTADFLPAGSMFAITTLHALRVLHQIPDFDTTTESITLSIKHLLNGGLVATDLDDMLIQLSDHTDEVYLVNEDGDNLENEDGDDLIADIVGEERYATHHKALDVMGISHQFEFSRESDSYSYRGSFSKRLLAFGFVGDIERFDV